MGFNGGIEMGSKDVIKMHQLIDTIYPSTSMGDYVLKEMLVMEAMKWKDDKFYTILACIKYSMEKHGIKGVDDFIMDIKKQWEE